VTTLFVVTLYPYSDGGEARYQFDTREMAEAFAAEVNDLPEDTLAYINGSGKPDKVAVWESGTYATVKEALEALGEWVTPEDEEPALCNASFMAGASCVLPEGHGGSHRDGS